MLTLDIESVKAFVTISDLKSFTRAAKELGSTQGALSVKLKRLESKLGKRLIERTPRQVKLSSYGELFIGPAKDLIETHTRAITSLTPSHHKFKLGIACHLVGPEITSFLTKIKSLTPSLLIEVKLDSSQLLLDKYNNGELDAIIVRSDDDRRNGTILCSEDFGWYASPDFKYIPKEPLQLASLTPDCGMANIATQVLEQASISWREVFVGGGVPVVMAAISAGLAVGVFPHRLAIPGLIDVGTLFNLPELPSSSIVMHSSSPNKIIRKTLQAIVSTFQ